MVAEILSVLASIRLGWVQLTEWVEGLHIEILYS